MIMNYKSENLSSSKDILKHPEYTKEDDNFTIYYNKGSLEKNRKDRKKILDAMDKFKDMEFKRTNKSVHPNAADDSVSSIKSIGGGPKVKWFMPSKIFGEETKYTFLKNFDFVGEACETTVNSHLSAIFCLLCT
mmetsp:Transcript_30404/g.27648  ORF Transcript_30404/g.27648 Transcript_30404/m.27648 type:complete len:134 (+) Transcript_30404:302-703(+)